MGEQGKHTDSGHPVGHPKHSLSFSDKASRHPRDSIKTGGGARRKLVTPGIARIRPKENAMNRHLCVALLLAATSAAPVIAQESTHTLATVQVHGALYVTQCNHRVPPTQRQFGEWTGIDNFGEAYAARERLISDIDRVCRRPGITKVQVIRDEDPGEGTRYVAAAVSAGH